MQERIRERYVSADSWGKFELGFERRRRMASSRWPREESRESFSSIDREWRHEQKDLCSNLRDACICPQG